MVVYAETALEKDAPAASDLAHQQVAGTIVQANTTPKVLTCKCYTRLWSYTLSSRILPTMSADEDEDDETCGFCIFMKAGGCKDEFKVRLTSSCGCKYQIHICTQRPGPAGLEQVC